MPHFPQALEPLAVDAIVARLAELLAARCDSSARAPRRQDHAHRAVERARDFLVAEAPRIVASEELERVSGLDRFALSRHFRAAFGTSPHRFQVGQRLVTGAGPDRLRRAAVGDRGGDRVRRPEPFHAAFFAARFGLTPGRWAKLAQ